MTAALEGAVRSAVCVLFTPDSVRANAGAGNEG